MSDSVLDRVQILVADQHAEMRALTRMMLSEIGFTKVATAADGGDAYRKFVEQPASIVLTELHMEPLDGLELVRLIRGEPGSPNQRVPIVMLTGDAAQASVLRARDAGVNDFLTKPVSIDTLFAHIRGLVARPRTFVRCATFFGPDRRRHAVAPRGPDRRRSAGDRHFGETRRRVKGEWDLGGFRPAVRPIVRSFARAWSADPSQSNERHAR